MRRSLWLVGLGVLLMALFGLAWLLLDAPEKSGTPASVGITDSAAPIVESPSSGVPLPASSGDAKSPVLSQGAQVQSPAGFAASSQANAQGGDSSAQGAGSQKSREERRKSREQIRLLSAQLQAKGANASLQDVQTYLNSVERLGSGELGGHYFRTMRLILEQSARAQELNQELAAIPTTPSQAQQARKREILAQLRDIGSKISGGAATLQSYARDAGSSSLKR